MGVQEGPDSESKIMGHNSNHLWIYDADIIVLVYET